MNNLTVEIHNSKVPSRVAFFGWTVALDKILTHDNLRKMSIVIVEWCCMCKKNRESVDHLLLHCELTSRLWNYAFSLFGAGWVMPRSFLDFLACWNQVGGRDISKVIWRMVPLCIIWCIWWETNA